MKQGLLSIGITPIRGSFLITDAIIEFNQKYPGIKINMVEYEMSTLTDLVLNGSIDFFIGNSPIQNNLLTMKTIGIEHLFWAVPQNNPNNKGLEQYQVPLQEIIENNYSENNSVDFSIFSNDPFILLQPNQHIHTLLLDLCNNAGFKPNVVLQINKLETAYSLVQKGLGVTIVSDTLIRHANLEDHPIYYALPEKSSVRNIIVVYKKNRYISHMAEKFISILKNNLL
ncbi:DNA-binding transcriptional LysR family regulator [Clostridium algifaecis]|uniref:DNA-binding transcriptional LysR family regulator n=1 Tax=Clostridium algifaecis TaxID=1472040 RepID=A0ABS4KTV4_9CLOT|nr:LysR family transcriptional regulator substrate-binding protein [Clostridium algifaecis]MBP2032876.1 DNA-binding transcriptional LysR family regulator [Clostridium algifaecis]